MSFCRDWHIKDNNSDIRNPKIDDETTERLLKVFEALSIIKDLPESRGKIKCPKCGGDLHYTRAKSNGHVWGNCKTEGCLSWMQ